MNAETVAYRDQLQNIEASLLSGLDLVGAQLSRVLESLYFQDVELAQIAAEANAEIERRYVILHGRVIAALALQAQFASDLRFLVAALQINRSIDRIGEQCVGIARLVPLSGHEGPKDRDLLEMVKEMGTCAHSQITHVRDALRMQHAGAARLLPEQDALIDDLNRRVFERTILIGDEPELREWAMLMTLVARNLERVGDNTVGIANQVIVITQGHPPLK